MSYGLPCFFVGHEWKPVGDPYEYSSDGVTFGPHRCQNCGKERLRTCGFSLSETSQFVLSATGVILWLGTTALAAYLIFN